MRGCRDPGGRQAGERTGERAVKPVQMGNFLAVLKTARPREGSRGFESHPRRFSLNGGCTVVFEAAPQSTEVHLFRSSPATTGEGSSGGTLS
jgi:hypothetical protein